MNFMILQHPQASQGIKNSSRAALAIRQVSPPGASFPFSRMAPPIHMEHQFRSGQEPQASLTSL